MKDGGVTEQRGSLVLDTCTDAGLRAESGRCRVLEEDLVAVLQEKL